MSKTVQRTVHVLHPDTLENHVLTPGMKVPKWAEDQVTNPKVFEKDESTEAPVNDQPAVNPDTGEEVDGTDVEPVEPPDPGEVVETANANPAQRSTAGEPGGNQSVDGEPAPADAGAAEGAPTPPETPAKKTAAPAKKTAAKRPARKAAKKSTSSSS